MFEFLEQLIDQGEFSKGLQTAEKLLLRPDTTPQELVALHTAILRCRTYTNEFHGAVMSGQLALRLAEDQEDWDNYGTICLYLSVVFDRLGQLEAAKSACYDYLAHRHLYSRALKHEVLILYNLGIFSMHLGDRGGTWRYLSQALELAIRLGYHRYAHGVRHGLIQASMSFGEYGRVPNLLAQCLFYLRNHPHVYLHRESLLYHYELRAEFALLTGRLKRALLVARKGLLLAGDSPKYRYYFTMIMARIAHRMGDVTTAVAHSLNARVYAVEQRRFDLESQAAEFMYGCIKLGSEPLERQLFGSLIRVEELGRRISGLP